MAREMRPNDAYAAFASNFEESIGSAIFLEPKVKVYPLQTSGGKSHYQDKEMPLELKKAFPQMKYIFRLSPTREVAHDGTFEKVHEISTDGGTGFSFIADPPSSSILDCIGNMPNTVLCVSCTHTYFTTNFERLLEYASDSILVIEEAHQFIGAADPGSESYVINFGYSSEYTAETWQRIEKWRDINPRIIGFTATPTEHHKGHSSLSDQFRVCGELADKKVILPSQAWMNKSHDYAFTKYQGQSSVEPAIHQSIDLLFEREQKLIDLKYFSLENDKQLISTYHRSGKDSHINTKLTAMYVCGDSRGVWGCPIAKDESKDVPIGVKEIISGYLIADCGFNESDKMIATMVENSSGGNTIWTLGGVAAEKVDNQTLMKRLHDENDPLRFLLVINRGRSGINVHNLTAQVVCRIRDPKEVRTPIPIQIFGRMVRLNAGTGDIVRKKYMNNLDNYLKHYPEDYNVDVEKVVETIKIANVFDIWHPSNGKAKRTWEESLIEFQRDYVNSVQDGYDYLYEFSGVEKPNLEPTNLEIEVECPCDGSKFMVNVNKEIQDWKGDGTLDKFFNIV
tara:strand:+ start:456 stop:2153 length:1698 start_codon:yes stop_codon:yes gene_type:complete